ncbi:uncharacterized protein LOC134193812 [Corticium candelabrum]|uniref:uncharacterized protein LOC134193812 n=1 Tax=Corticium candelabrum TaxID=121492 RepID=UPI002E25AF3B|nr:uncharacterized protein LOC134193812 [Corticium candelabrum]
MDTVHKLHIVLQFLHEEGYTRAFEALENDSEVTYNANAVPKTGQLQAILDEYHERDRQRVETGGGLDDLLERRDGVFANKLHVSLDCLAPSSSILSIDINSLGVLAIGTNSGALLVTTLPNPLPFVTPVLFPITSQLHKGGLLGLNFHPDNAKLLLTCGMDRTVNLVDVSSDEIKILQTFTDHQKYVVRVLWTTSGKFFISSSYDRTVNIYRQESGESLRDAYIFVQKLQFKGAVEAISFFHTSDTFVVGVRDDYRLHSYELSGNEVEKRPFVNLNALGDSFVSFTAMDVSLSFDDRYILVSTDKNRLILYSTATGQQVANFYGAVNDEYSCPRHCWHPSSHYIYATSQDKLIHVWEVSTQKLVASLDAHTGVVRGLTYCRSLKMLLSCGFDGVVNVWSQSERE